MQLPPPPYRTLSLALAAILASGAALAQSASTLDRNPRLGPHRGRVAIAD